MQLNLFPSKIISLRPHVIFIKAFCCTSISRFKAAKEHNKCKTTSDSLWVKRHSLLGLRARCVCNAKMKCRSACEPLLPESIKIAWLGKHGGNVSLASSNSGYIWAPTPQLLSWETAKDSEEKPRHLNAFQFVKFPIFPVDGEKD
jgi:hypothetical protein